MTLSEDEAFLVQDLEDAVKMDVWFYLRYNDETDTYYVEDLEEDVIMTIEEALHLMFDGIDLDDIEHLGFTKEQVESLKIIEQRLKGENV